MKKRKNNQPDELPPKFGQLDKGKQETCSIFDIFSGMTVPKKDTIASKANRLLKKMERQQKRLNELEKAIQDIIEKKYNGDCDNCPIKRWALQQSYFNHNGRGRNDY